jgi:hypothetical protein
LDTSSGAARWTFQLANQVRASSPAVDANGVVYIGCYDSRVYAVNADGTLLRTYDTAGVIRSNPAIFGQMLYIGSSDHKMYAFDIGTSVAGGSWPQYRQNARRTGRALLEAPSIALAPKAISAVAGESVTLGVAAAGTGPFTYQWIKDGELLPGATNSTVTLTGVTAASTANYAVSIGNAQGSVTSAPAPVTVRPVGAPELAGRLVNLSVRTGAGTGSQTLIIGFVVTGSPEKSLLIRAIGPTLAQFGISGALLDPRLQLLSGSTVLSENDNWFTAATGGGAAVAAAFATTGAFPLETNSLDAAILRNIGFGAYTAQVTASSGTGIALVELYDTAAAGGARLVNVSARSQVNTGSDILITGFSVSGNQPKTVLIRAVGPSLAGLGVTGVLIDPRLAIYRADTKLAENDDWGASPQIGAALSLAATFAQVGAFPLSASGSKDAALLVTLTPGSYTAQVSGTNGSTGVALVEVYEVP